MSSDLAVLFSARLYAISLPAYFGFLACLFVSTLALGFSKTPHVRKPGVDADAAIQRRLTPTSRVPH